MCMCDFVCTKKSTTSTSYTKPFVNFHKNSNDKQSESKKESKQAI